MLYQSTTVEDSVCTPSSAPPEKHNTQQKYKSPCLVFLKEVLASYTGIDATRPPFYKEQKRLPNQISVHSLPPRGSPPCTYAPVFRSPAIDPKVASTSKNINTADPKEHLGRHFGFKMFQIYQLNAGFRTEHRRQNGEPIKQNIDCPSLTPMMAGVGHHLLNTLDSTPSASNWTRLVTLTSTPKS